MKFRKGFTLIEVLIVIVIIGTLSAIIFTSLNNARAKARDSQRISSIKEVQKALALYHAANGSYPVSVDFDWMGSISDYGSYDVSGSNGYIPNLAPSYISKLPTDSKQTASIGYLYKSDGNNYSFVAHGMAEGPIPNSLKIPADTSGKDIAISTTGFSEGTFAIPGYVPTTKMVSGNITYSNLGSNPMHNVTIYLKQSGVIKYTTVTPASGTANYSFSAVEPGVYDVYFSLPTVCSYINNTDAAVLNAWVSNTSNFGGIQVLAGDVYQNSPSIIVDANDPTEIQHYFASGWNTPIPPRYVFIKIENLMTPFNSFPIPYAAANDTPAYSSISLTVDSSDVVQNFKSLCYGDINQSYSPL